MHILLISRCPPYPLHLGDRLIIYHLARELSQRGHILDLVAFNDRPEIPDERDAYASYFRHVEIVPQPRRTQASYFRRLLLPGSRFPHRAEQSWSPAMWNAIRRRLDENTYTLAHLFGGVQVYEYYRALESLPALITPYESYSLYLSRRVGATCILRIPKRTEGSPSPLQRLTLAVQLQIARAFERFMFTPYGRTVVVSERDSDELRALNSALTVSVIPNGVDLESFKRGNTARENATLLFTGNYEYAPNVDAALYLADVILPKVHAQISEAKLWLVGSAPPPELLALSSDQITVTGHVPDIRPYLEKATVFVCPLRLGAGIKNKVLEALALGCPVIATPLSVDGIAVQHERDALIAELDALPDTVIRLLRDSELQHRLARGGRALVETHYTWARTADMYEELYQAVSDQVQC